MCQLYANKLCCTQVFISDIRACQNREQETKRVDKELAKIRGKFGDDKKTLTGAQHCHGPFSHLSSSCM